MSDLGTGPSPLPVAAFHADYQDLQLHIQVFLDKDLLPLTNARELPRALGKKVKKGEWAYFDILISSTREDAQACHLFVGQLLPTDEGELQEELSILLDEDGILEEVDRFWVRYEEAEKRKGVPSWGTPT